MENEIASDSGYREWLLQHKDKIRSTQHRAALLANEELLSLYWHLRQQWSSIKDRAGWGEASANLGKLA